MDETEIKTPAQPELVQLREQFEALRHLVVSILVLLIVVCGTLDVYLLRQRNTTRKDLKAIAPQAMNIINTYQQGQGAWIDDFIRKVSEYGRTHTDFAPIMTKYGLHP